MVMLNRLENTLNKIEFKNEISKLYGSDQEIIDSQINRYKELSNLFSIQFPDIKSARIFSTSGRTEIAGNHTDHQRGNVLCASVDLDIIAFASKNDDHIIRLKSKGYTNMDVINLEDLSPNQNEKFHSASLIRGIAAEFKNRGFKFGGFDAYTSSNVPKGSGLSSSAAFEILVSTILNYLYNDNSIDTVTLAQISQGAENNFFGKPCGLMDQCGCAVGKVMTIDFENASSPIVESLNVDFEKFGLGIVITNTGGSHSNLNDEYAAITTDMRSVANYFGKDVLREVQKGNFYSYIPSLQTNVSQRAILRAMHYFDDNQRVSLQAKALKENDINLFLQLVNESGNSSWMLLQNIYSAKSIENQPVALALAVTKNFLGQKGACRVHGGGFAGTIQAFVPLDMINEYIKLMESIFGNGSSNLIKIRNHPTSEVIIN